MRVYVPYTLQGLATAYAAAELGPAPVAAYAVTPALREWYAEGDDEEMEYAALMQAARASLGLLAAAHDPAGSGARRVVVVCEVGAVPPPNGAAEPGEAGLTLGTVIPWSVVAAVHVDAPDAGTTVASAVAVWDAAQNGDDDARFTVEACDGEDLLWYATQEVPDLLT